MVDIPASSNELLCKILDVLNRIDGKLKVQEEQFKCLEDLVKTNCCNRSISESGSADTLVESSVKHLGPPKPPQPEDESFHPNLDSYMWQVKKAVDRVTLSSVKEESPPEKYPYTEWERVNRCVKYMGELVDVDFYLFASGQVGTVQEYLGDWWTIPDDSRCRLTFSNHAYQKAREFLDAPFVQPPTSYYAIDKMKAARQFNDTLRAQPGNDFITIDFDEQNNYRLYRLGEKAIGNPLMIDRGNHPVAPWSRLIVYQGMTSGESSDTRNLLPRRKLAMPMVYFRGGDTSPGLWAHLSTHLQNKCRDVTVNLYLDHGVGFHTSFYEIMRDKDQHEAWKHGPLYSDPLERSFRKCAYTVSSTSHSN